MLPVRRDASVAPALKLPALLEARDGERLRSRSCSSRSTLSTVLRLMKRCRHARGSKHLQTVTHDQASQHHRYQRCLGTCAPDAAEREPSG